MPARAEIFLGKTPGIGVHCPANRIPFMKKAILGILAILIVGSVFFFVARKRSGALGESVADTLAPGNTVALVELTDVPRTRNRWKETALFKIAHEPALLAFLEKPKSKIPRNPEMEAQWEHARKIDPKEAFIAFTSITDRAPKFVAGFDYKGKREDVEALLADARTKAKSEFPSAKWDIVKYGASEIETFALGETRGAAVFKDRWFFIADDLDLLKSTLDRLDGKSTAKGALRDNAAYKASLAKLPPNSDAVIFVQPQTLTDRLATLVTVSNPNFDSKQLDGIKKIQAIAGGMKFDGEKIRDAIYVLKPGGGKQPPMARNSLAFTSPETLFYYAAILKLAEAPPRLPDPSLDTTGILGALDVLRQALEKQGLVYADFKSAFGPEIGAVVDWAAGAMQPTLLLSLDVSDAAKAQKFIGTLTNGGTGFLPWVRQEIDGAQFYSLPMEPAGLTARTPVLTLTDKTLLFGLDLDSMKSAVKHGKSGEARLDRNAAFQTAGSTVRNPSAAFGYIDSRSLFEKVYGVASNMLKMMALFNPLANDYIDLGKLPDTEVIGRHLSPIVYSQSADDTGFLAESMGPVTFNQAALVVAAGVGAAVFQQHWHQAPSRPAVSRPSVPPALPMPGQATP